MRWWEGSGSGVLCVCEVVCHMCHTPGATLVLLLAASPAAAALLLPLLPPSLLPLPPLLLPPLPTLLLLLLQEPGGADWHSVLPIQGRQRDGGGPDPRAHPDSR